jgi:membrane fusion protein, multidrug efflux system
MIRNIVLAIVLLLAVVGGLAGVKIGQIRKLIANKDAFAPPPESVSTFVAQEENWQATLTAIGSITAKEGVMVTPEIPGLVREIAFESGATVAKGDLLVRLDTSLEEAQLRAIEAQVELARLNVERVRSLRKENTISQSELDTAESTLKQYQANADAISATIAKKTIRAPFAGSLGIRLVNHGQYLDTGKPIVSLQALSQVYAEFSLPQQELARLKTGMTVRLTTDAWPDRSFEGALNAINPDLDQATRSVSLQATFDNPQHLLRPGMFARIEVLLPDRQQVLVIPTTAVLLAPFGDSVYIVESKPGEGHAKPTLTVRQQFVRTSRARGDFVAVESGLKPGERIVSSGLFKLRNGMTILENNELVPKSTETPRPADS